MEFKISRSIYNTLYQAYRPFLAKVFFLLVIGLIGRYLILSTSQIIAKQLDQMEHIDVEMLKHLIAILGVLLALSVVLTLTYRIIFSRLSAAAVSTIYDETTYRVSRFPMSFFDSQPVGKIMSRFSSDYGSIFRLFGGPLAEFGSIIFDIICIIIINCTISFYYLVPQLLALAAFYFILKINQKKLRECRNQVSLLRAPSVSHFSETVQGATNIRLASKNSHFLQRFIQLDRLYIDTKENLFKQIFTFSSQLNFMSFILFTTNGLISVYLIKKNYVGISEAAVVMAYTVFSTQSLQMFFEWFSQFDEALIGVQRLDEYLRSPLEKNAKLPYQARFTTGQDREKTEVQNLPDCKEKLIIKDLSLQYKEGDPLILKNISVEIYPGEKIGIIGKTGAGKSSFISAILKLYPEKSGQIYFERNEDLDLTSYRNHFSVVTQETFFVRASLRDNLDIAHIYSQEKILQTLEKVGISIPLDYEIKEKGSNLSEGQKQQISLARALLRQSPVVIFDEATASIDPQSEEVLVHALNTELKDKTQIIIAHRLSTIQECDRLIWLDHGQIKKIGPAKEVLEAFTTSG